MESDCSDFASLSSEWEHLWRRDALATPFQSPWWMSAWWKHFGADSRPLLLTQRRDGGELQSILPLCVLQNEEESLGILMGTGISDSLDAIVAPGATEWTWKLPSACDAWDLQALPQGGHLMQTPSPDGWEEWREKQEPSPVLSLQGARSIEELLSGHARKKLRYLKRLLRPKVVTCSEEAQLPGFAASLFALHTACWRARGLPGLLSDPETQAFHRQVMCDFLRQGLLRMHLLISDGAPAAIYYGFAHRGVHFYYLGGYEPSLRRFSPGWLMIALAIEKALEEGASSFDFLRGAEAYKYGWGAIDRPSWRRVLRQ